MIVRSVTSSPTTPTTTEPLTASVTVSLTDAEKAKLAADAKAAGTSMSALSRKRITAREV